MGKVGESMRQKAAAGRVIISQFPCFRPGIIEWDV
jgi:hypothetical protein